MPGTSQLASLLVGLTVGNILGIYLAQTYELPDLHSLGQTIFSKAKEFEKSRSDDSKEKWWTGGHCNKEKQHSDPFSQDMTPTSSLQNS